MRQQTWMVTVLVGDAVTLNEVEEMLHAGIENAAGNPEAIVEMHLHASRSMPETFPLREPEGWVMPNGEKATRLDFIRAKLGTGPWPEEGSIK